MLPRFRLDLRQCSNSLWLFVVVAVATALPIGNTYAGPLGKLRDRALQWIPRWGQAVTPSPSPSADLGQLPQSSPKPIASSPPPALPSVAETPQSIGTGLKSAEHLAADNAAGHALAALGVADSTRTIGVQSVPQRHLQVLPPLSEPHDAERTAMLGPRPAPNAIPRLPLAQNAFDDTPPWLDDGPLSVDGEAPSPSTSRPSTLPPSASPQQPAAAGSPASQTPALPDEQNRPVDTENPKNGDVSTLGKRIDAALAQAGSNPQEASNGLLQCLADVAGQRDQREGTGLYTESLENAVTALIEFERLATAIRDASRAGNETPIAEVAATFTSSLGRSLREGTLSPRRALTAYPNFIKQSFFVAAGNHPEASRAFAGLAHIHLRREAGENVSEQERIRLLLDTAVAVDPGNWQAANELGIAFAQSERLSDARAAFESSLAAHPTPQALKNLARVCAQQGDRIAARDYVRRASELSTIADGREQFSAPEASSPARIAKRPPLDAAAFVPNDHPVAKPFAPPQSASRPQPESLSASASPSSAIPDRESLTQTDWWRRVFGRKPKRDLPPTLQTAQPEQMRR